MIMFIHDVPSYAQVAQMDTYSQEQVLPIQMEHDVPDYVALVLRSLHENTTQRKQHCHKNFSNSVVDLSHVPLTAEEAKEIPNKIFRAFNMTTKDLAAILRVERQTIYAWIRGENIPSLENSRRLRIIFAFAETWNSLSKVHARTALRVPFGEKQSRLLDLLKQENLDEAEIRRILPIAAAYVRERTPYRPSIEEQLREAGLDPAKYRVPQHDFDAVTSVSHFSAEVFE